MPDAADQLRSRWQRFWHGREAPECEPLLRRYAESHRAYHNAGHIVACLAEYDAHGHGRFAPALELALWFHDAVYDPHARDNELQSALFAESTLAGFVDVRGLQQIRRLIQVTDHKTSPAAADEQLIVDIDLSILGQRAEVFDAYETAIRLEYAHVPEDLFRKGRAAVLRHFLGRASVYNSGAFRQLYEWPARANLTRSISHLEAGTTTSEPP